MCKKHPDWNTTLTTPGPTFPQGYCPPFYHQYRDRCYNLGPDLVSWDEALDRCSSLHPDNMVSIRDEKEQGKSLKYNRNLNQTISWVKDSSPYLQKYFQPFCLVYCLTGISPSGLVQSRVMKENSGGQIIHQ